MGLIASKYQSHRSRQKKSYSVVANSAKRYCASDALAASTVSANRPRIQRSASVISSLVVSVSSVRIESAKRVAFHSLFARRWPRSNFSLVFFAAGRSSVGFTLPDATP